MDKKIGLALVILGLAALTYGVCLIYAPVGLVVLGLLVAGVGLMFILEAAK